MSDRKLIILRGNSGSGKSSLAKALQRKIGRNTLIIPQDTVRREMLWVHDGVHNLALPLMTELLIYGYEHCAITILEGILNAEWYKPLFETAIALFADRIFAYYYDLPFDETLKRHATKRDRFDFGEEEMRRWWNEKDYIGFIPETTILKETSLEDAVDSILKAISV
ncbi:MAG: kinase [Clostridia bacterium]|nr:kinase [Clostridia bacterium]